MRANLLQITPPNPVQVTDPEKDLNALFETIIGETARTPREKSLRKSVGEKLSQAGLDRKLIRDVEIHVDVLERDIQFPFAFQNRRFNLINPVRFEAQNPDQSIATACKYAVEGQSIYRRADPERGEMQLVILGQFRSNDNTTREAVGRVFGECRVKLFEMNRFADLVDEIRQTGKDVELSPAQG
jgi:hypothetical protein